MVDYVIISTINKSFIVIFNSGLNHESIASSKLLSANIYDMEGNILLQNEYVLMSEGYSFEKFSPSVHLLRGLFRS